ncbi:hypothetical protein D3C80_1701440 [compost metagenome]
MLNEGGAVPAAVLVEIGAGMHAVFVPIAADQQVVLLTQGQVVLPGNLIAIGVEHGVLIAELVAFVVTVFAVGKLQARMPGVVELGVEVRAQAADAEVGVGFLPEAFESDRVKATVRIVVFTAPATVEQVQACLEAFAEGVAEAQVE